MNAAINSDERAAFEAAYPSIHPVQNGPDIFERNGEGYAYLRVQGAWEGWQARAAAGVAQVPAQTMTRPMCRDCADFGPICPNSGERCDGRNVAAGAAQILSPSDAQITEIARAACKEGRLIWGGFQQDGEGKWTVPSVSPSVNQLVREVVAALSQQGEAK